MLIEIYCEKFLQKRVSFSEGLNIIAGDGDGTNSIGKTTMLYIIDYMFGGSSYLSKSKEVFQQIGHHTIYAIFKFKGVLYYFSRATDLEVITVYNGGFEKDSKTLSVSDYTTLLKQNYGLTEINDTFRNIVTRFARIYRKGSSNVEEPFAAIEKEATKKGVSMLLNLFELSSEIKDSYKKKELAENEQKTFNSAKKFNLVPTINKIQFKKNNKDIEILEKEKQALSNDSQITSLNVDAIVSSEVEKLRKIKSKYVIDLSSVESNLDKITLKQTKELTISYPELNELFPNISIKTVEEIQSFHKTLKENLSEQILEFTNTLENKKRMLINEINKCDEELRKISSTKNVPVAILSKYSLLDQQIQKMKLQNEYYDKNTEISERKQKAINSYNELVENALKTIEKKINDGIEKFRLLIDKDAENQGSPKIELKPNSYKMDFNVDRGTGTAFTTLINIDLVILSETKLPYVIEDSIIFKNISNQRMRNIFAVYENITNKQIFIALDKILEYGKEFYEAVEKCKVLQLSEDKPLFGKKFSIKQNGVL